MKQAIANALEARKERKFTETVDVAINLRDVDLGLNIGEPVAP